VSSNENHSSWYAFSSSQIQFGEPSRQIFTGLSLWPLPSESVFCLSKAFSNNKPLVLLAINWSSRMSWRQSIQPATVKPKLPRYADSSADDRVKVALSCVEDQLSANWRYCIIITSARKPSLHVRLQIISSTRLLAVNLIARANSRPLCGWRTARYNIACCKLWI
jgi:hypothetical protein